jgi:beta-glucosidase
MARLFAAGTAVAALASAAALALPAVPASARPGGRAITSQSTARAQCPWVTSTQPIAERVAEVMNQMTLSDEISVVEGHGTRNPYVFYMPGISRLCIPALGLEDGPSGVADGLDGVTQLPAAVALAATWDPSLASQYGQAIGSEEAGKGASADLGPTVNVDRDPRWGRSFEAYSEDPLLDAAVATATIDGVQSQRVMAQVKHFDAYNQETYRNTSADDVIVSSRALHEIYMPAFEAAVKQAGAASAMCAYSMVNGNFSCSNSSSETSVLRQEWDFPGFVTSDYGALHGTPGAVDGTDMEQPSDTYFGARLRQDVTNDTIPRAVLNTMVQRILTEMFRFNLISRPPTGSASATVTTPAHVAVSTRVAVEGTTLLKNDGEVLPLSAAGGGTIAVIGPSASASPTYAGGGSAYVIPSRTVSPLQGIQAAAGPGTTVSYRQGLPADTALPAIPSASLTPAYAGTSSGGSYTGTLTVPETGTYVLAITNSCRCYAPTYLSLNGQVLVDDPGTPPVTTYSASVSLHAGQRYTVSISGASSHLAWGTPSLLAPGIAQAVTAAKSATTAVVVVSDDTESEEADRPSLNLASAQNELISAVAAANPHTVVVIDAGAPVAMPWRGQVAGIVDSWYPGQTGGTALAHVLFGTTDPGGHLPVTFPAGLSQVPAATRAEFPGTGSRVRYREGIDVGYRWYDANGITPLFPFGFGLSYTSFAFSNLQVSPSTTDGVRNVRVSATITNVGKRAGSDVAQLYLGDPAAAGEPPRQLAGFQRVTLAPGRSASLRFTITPRDTWWWDESAGGWSQTAGTYQVDVGDSSALANLPLHGTFTMTSTPASRQVSIQAPATMQPGRPSAVRVTLSAAGDETLQNVTLSLQLPQGWTVTPSQAVFSSLSASQAPVATFTVRPPGYAPNTSAVVHATANLGGTAQREAGVTVTVR